MSRSTSKRISFYSFLCQYGGIFQQSSCFRQKLSEKVNSHFRPKSIFFISLKKTKINYLEHLKPLVYELLWSHSSFLLQISSHNRNYLAGKEFYLQGLNRFSDRSTWELKAMLLRAIPFAAVYKGES